MNNETMLVIRRSNILVAGYTHEYRVIKNMRDAPEIIESYIKKSRLSAIIPQNRAFMPTGPRLLILYRLLIGSCLY